MSDTSPRLQFHRAELPPAVRSFSGLATLASGAIIIAALYFGRDVLVPLALALLLSFVLAPGVSWLRRWHAGRVTSVLVMVAFAFVVILGLGAVFGSQVTSLGENLPRYEWNVRNKIRSLKDWGAEVGVIERVSNILRNLNEEIAKRKDVQPLAESATAKAPPEPKPISVEIRQPDPRPLDVVQSIIGPVLEPLATTGIIIVFVIFMLLKREDLRDRFIRLAGVHDLHRTTQAITDAGQRVSRYLLMQTVVNAMFGLPIGIGLWLIGVPNPVLWGILAMVLRFVPLIGPFIAAVFPIALSLAVDPGWMMLVWTVALFLAVELIIQYLIEPWLYGSSTGLSTAAILVAAVFWTWLWGPVGLLLSTPLTACIVVLGRHVPPLQFLDVLLGNRPVLMPAESFYQRVLADDPAEVAYQAEQYLKQMPLLAYYDEVVIPGLALAQSDVKRGKLDSGQRSQMRSAIEDVIEDLADHEDIMPPAEGTTATAGDSRMETKESAGEPALVSSPVRLEAMDLLKDWQAIPILCIASRTELDEAAARILAQLLVRSGINARVLPWEAVSAGNLALVDVPGVQMLCISCLDPRLSTHVRYLSRRLRRKFPRTTILVGFWTLASDDALPDDLLTGTGADLVARSLREALELVCRMARQTPEPVALPVEQALSRAS
jgi:predicted PurR-regulated permease PerM